MQYEEVSSFGFVDYFVFGAMLLISLGIGIYMSFKGNKTTEDYLMGSRTFSPIPIAMSLLTSFISSIILLGFSGEVYANGLQISLFLVGNTFGMLLTTVLTLPVFYPLRLTSVNEYIELRFRSPRLRGCITVVTCIKGFIYMGICLYAPTVALASITPFSSLTYILLLGIVCSFYSTIGGIRAVVWTDVFQLVVMLIGLFVVTVLGCVDVGGLGKVWSIASEGKRTDIFNMNPSIYERHSFYSTLIFGFSISLVGYGVSQINLQRMCSVRTIRDAKRILVLNIFGMIFIQVLIYLSGLVVYASYYGCDPMLLGKIKRKEEIVPYYIVDRLGYITGLPGLFTATLVGGALSSLSSVISAQVAMIWKDACRAFKIFDNASQNVATLINKILSMLTGVSLIGMAILASKAKSLIQFSMTITSIAFGPVFGVFLLGLLFPKCNLKGVWCGFVISCLFLCWISTGGFLYLNPPEPLAFSIENCNFTVLNNFTHLPDIFQNSSITNIGYTVTDSTETQGNNFPMMWLYSISYNWYPFFGPVICIVIAMIVSYLTGLEDPEKVPPELTATFIRKYYWRKNQCEKLDQKKLNLIVNNEDGKIETESFLFRGVSNVN